MSGQPSKIMYGESMLSISSCYVPLCHTNCTPYHPPERGRAHFLLHIVLLTPPLVSWALRTSKSLPLSMCLSLSLRMGVLHGLTVS